MTFSNCQDSARLLTTYSFLMKFLEDALQLKKKKGAGSGVGEKIEKEKYEAMKKQARLRAIQTITNVRCQAGLGGSRL